MGYFSPPLQAGWKKFRLSWPDIAFWQTKSSISGMFVGLEDQPMRALSLCRSRLQTLQRRVDRWHTMTFYGAISFMTLIVLLTLPYRPF
ncbi:hypothetical protein [Bradyrhizobium sp. LHD-71]|uniref:hypothetical protein n=1 Tax=Bradyrhizobium sp. LHD-71 TaxID=3072141 RepID=UPI00280FBE9D|nr:hypothetical protein [Bradyrhizobium sp. LHD-71]MDQ8728918.1 hypothetical protein [Bradyrhizobium sp. LHD-71]